MLYTSTGPGHLLETVDIWRWLLTGTPPQPVDAKRHDAASLADVSPSTATTLPQDRSRRGQRRSGS